MLKFFTFYCSMIFTLTLAAWLGMGQIAQAQEAANLRPKLVEGRETRFEVWGKRETEVTMTAQGQSQAMSSTLESTSEIVWRVDRVNDDGSAVCSMIYQSFTMTISDGEGNQFEVDTQAGTADEAVRPLLDIFNAVINKPLTVNLDATGRISSLQGVDAIAAALDDPETAPKEKDFLNTARQLAIMEGAPETGNVGATWNNNFETSHDMGTLEYDMRYQLDALGEMEDIPVAVVNAVGTVNLQVDRSELPEDADINVRQTEGAAESQVIFDLDRGEVVARNSTTRLNVNVSFSPIPEVTLQQESRRTDQSQVLRIAE